MARYTLLCCWIFFWQTTTQMLITVLPPTSALSTRLQISFNSVFSVTYTSFLMAYCFVHRRPAGAYIVGVLLYTLGYMTFLAYFYIMKICEGMSGSDPDDMGAKELYLLGSGLFLSGSISLTLATMPDSTSLSWSPFAKKRFSFLGQHVLLIRFHSLYRGCCAGDEWDGVHAMVGHYRLCDLHGWPVLLHLGLHNPRRRLLLSDREIGKLARQDRHRPNRTRGPGVWHRPKLVRNETHGSKTPTGICNEKWGHLVGAGCPCLCP